MLDESATLLVKKITTLNEAVMLLVKKITILGKIAEKRRQLL